MESICIQPKRPCSKFLFEERFKGKRLFTRRVSKKCLENREVECRGTAKGLGAGVLRAEIPAMSGLCVLAPSPPETAAACCRTDILLARQTVHNEVNCSHS